MDVRYTDHRLLPLPEPDPKAVELMRMMMKAREEALAAAFTDALTFGCGFTEGNPPQHRPTRSIFSDCTA